MLILVFFFFLFRGHRSHPIRSLSSPDDHCSQQIQSVSRSDGGSAPRDNLYSSEHQRRPVHHQWGPHHLRQPSEKDHWNQWSPYNLTLLQLEQTNRSSGRRGTGPPTEPGFSQGFFSPFCHRWSFSSLTLSPLACLVADTSFPVISPTWLHRYYLNWTELNDDTTEFNNEMPLLKNGCLILSFYISDTLFWYCEVALTQFVLLKVLYK